MANGGSFFSFVSGMVAGAAIAILTCTERGHEFMRDVEKKCSKLYDSVKKDYDVDDDFMNEEEEA